MSSLPIQSLLPDILKAWEKVANLVIEAPTGAGKTTGLPLALLDAPWPKKNKITGKKILLLEPRRLPTRAAAERLAGQLGEKVGGRVGYQVRLEKKIGPTTELEVLTYGLFLKRIQADPALEDIGLVLFDEFHERSIEADLSFAFTWDCQQALRPDLRIGLLSATFDGTSLSDRIPQSQLLRSEGRLFPIETFYIEPSSPRLEDNVASAIRRALREGEGDILIFLAGGAEIRRVMRAIEDLGENHRLLALHGDLPLSEQDRVIKPDPQGKRKIILSTNIAETSLTIEGVRIVIDSGQKRVASFDPASGMTKLVTRRIALSEADQRRGRAGRTAPGLCYRLWPAAEEKAFARFAEPEIKNADLAPFALELAAWGGGSETLLFLDPPSPSSLCPAYDLLRQLDAMDENNRITDLGRAMNRLGTHPRLAHMILAAKEKGWGALAADIAAILSERDPLKSRDCDLRHRLEFLWGQRKNGERRDVLRRSAELFRKQARIDEKENAQLLEKTGAVLALAYPDRIAARRGAQYKMANGKGAILSEQDPLSREPFLAIAALDGDATQSRIFLAAPIRLEEIEEGFSSHISQERVIQWDRPSEQILSLERECLDALILRERPLANPASQEMIAAMIEGIRIMGLEVLPWDKESLQLQARALFLKKFYSNLPSFDSKILLEEMVDWLAPYLEGMNRRAHLERLNLKEALLSRLDWKEKQLLDQEAPTHIEVPSGSRLPIDYEQNEPVLAVRLQEMFGLAETPSIAKGRVPLILHLLSPARRPIQITRDLKGFWQNSYFEVRKDLRGQYPKHDWPDDPMKALPTARAKRRL